MDINLNKKKRILKNLGLNIKFYRQKMRFTQEEIAEKMNAQRSYITALECGYKSPSLYFLYELAQTLRVSLKELADINID